jgi:hypothetical protein
MRPTRLEPGRIEWRELQLPAPFTFSRAMNQTAQGMDLKDPGAAWWTYATVPGGEVHVIARESGRSFAMTAVITGEPEREPIPLDPAPPVQLFDVVIAVDEEPVFEHGRWVWHLDGGACAALQDPPPGLAVVGRVSAIIDEIEVKVIVCEIPDGPLLYVCAIDRPGDAEIQAIACRDLADLLRALHDDMEGWLECGAEIEVKFVPLMQLP